MKLHASISKVAIAASVAAAFSVATPAADTPPIDSRVQGALEHFYAQGPANRELASKAAAVLVFPRVTKAGAGVGGEFGEGALEVHGKTIGYYKMTSASVGATLGVARRSEVFLFMTDEARERFLHSRDWTVGADTNVAIAHKGTGAEYQSGALHKPVLAFVFGEQGLIGDASLEGTKVTKLRE
jgi:lipid-binding SYLF domain-containing protein